MDIALERGAIHTNLASIKPSEGRLKKKVICRTIVLPSVADVQRLLGTMEANGARDGWELEAADFCRFMWYTGCRAGEMPRVDWQCFDWHAFATAEEPRPATGSLPARSSGGS